MPDMLVEVPPAQREPLRPLFAGIPGLRGCIDAAFDGGMGRAWADDALAPSVALVRFDFYFLAGDPTAAAADEAVRFLDRRASIVTSGRDWELLLRDVWGDALTSRTRVEFAVGEWDRARLRGFIEALPDGYELHRITLDDAARFAELAGSLTYNFPSLEDFVARGVGFGIEHEGRFVSGCSSFAISPHSIEFEIQTHPDFRRRGLASAAAATMIEHCIERGLTPEWDAHNEMSSALAEKLGFVDPAPYTAYELRPQPTAAA